MKKNHELKNIIISGAPERKEMAEDIIFLQDLLGEMYVHLRNIYDEFEFTEPYLSNLQKRSCEIMNKYMDNYLMRVEQ